MKEKELNISIVRMAEIPARTDISRWELIRYTGAPVNIELSTEIRRPKPDRVAITLSATYTTVRNMLRRRLMVFTSVTEFAIGGLDEVSDFDYGDALLPAGLASMLLGIALGGLRGMISLRTADTFLANYPLPLYDVRELASRHLKA